MGPSQPLLTTLAVVGSVFLVRFALRAASLQRDGSALDPHVRMHHWTTMAALGMGVALVGLLAAMRTRGWRVPAWTAGAAAGVYGTASLAFPTSSGASGWRWGAVALVGRGGVRRGRRGRGPSATPRGDTLTVDMALDAAAIRHRAYVWLERSLLSAGMTILALGVEQVLVRAIKRGGVEPAPRTGAEQEASGAPSTNGAHPDAQVSTVHSG